MDVVATITSKWGGGGSYSPLPLGRVETYVIDSAMDTDADQWSLSIGDPGADLVDMLKRDSEVRVALAAATRSATLVPLLQGYADSIAITQDNTLQLDGRDLSAAAVDSAMAPFNWHLLRPAPVIKAQATKMGFSKFKLADVSPLPRFYTDGSETVWAFWYRMVRTKQMWIWVESDGTLNMDSLNYAAKPTYYFGWPTKDRPQLNDWIPVQSVEIRKNTQTRIGEVWVFGDTGKIGFLAKQSDKLIHDWIKKPLEIITADASHTTKSEAVKEAREEIFESIVGAIEITIQIADPGFPILQNKTAYINFPKQNFEGEYFIIGVKKTADGSSGAVQEIRLREKKYALTKRVPPAPTINDPGKNVSTQGLAGALNIPKQDWSQFFVVAAKAWHGGWDFDLFLATLLAICQVETNFRNVRVEGNIEWYPPPANTQGGPQAPGSSALQQWKLQFSNDPGAPGNPMGHDNAAVGPMQLHDHSFKASADRYAGGPVDQYVGGRWAPNANIWVAAQVLIGKLQGLDPKNQDNIWIGVKAYNGSGPAADAYMKRVRALVLNTYLPAIKQAEKASSGTQATGTKTNADLPNAPTAVKRMINFAERQLGKAYSQVERAGPDSWDCSGLVWGCYNSAGLASRIGGLGTTYTYWANGKGYGGLFRVPKDQLRPGDMIFFDNHTEAPPGHMGIYYQNGQMIAATSSAHNPHAVLVESINEGPSLTYMGAMRLAGVWPATTTSLGNFGGPNDPRP